MKKTLWCSVLAAAFVISLQTIEASVDPRDVPANVPTALEQNPDYKWTPLHWAVRRGAMEAVHAQLGHGHIEARDFLGRTPLHIAVLAGQDDIVQILLENGADPNAQDNWHVTPLRRVELITEQRGWDRANIADMLRQAGGVKKDMGAGHVNRARP